MKYLIVEEEYKSDLTTIVNRLLGTDWKCQGGVSVNDLGKYLQAMIKEEA